MNRTETGNSRCVSKCLAHSLLRGFLFNWPTHWKQSPQNIPGQTSTQSIGILPASAIIKHPAHGLCILSVSYLWLTATGKANSSPELWTPEALILSKAHFWSSLRPPAHLGFCCSLAHPHPSHQVRHHLAYHKTPCTFNFEYISPK